MLKLEELKKLSSTKVFEWDETYTCGWVSASKVIHLSFKKHAGAYCGESNEIHCSTNIGTERDYASMRGFWMHIDQDDEDDFRMRTMIPVYQIGSDEIRIFGIMIPQDVWIDSVKPELIRVYNLVKPFIP
jgi:hypothetical protein